MPTRARTDARADVEDGEPARASTSRGAAETIEYGTFHARVRAVFGDGDGGAWRPRSNAVVRRGGDDDDDGEGGEGGGRRRRAEDARAREGEGEDAREGERYGDDLDCLESDEDGDDDARRMTRLAASVGRCRALDGEADFDEDDALALGVDARERRSMRGVTVTSTVERARAVGAVGAPRVADRVPDHIANPAKYTRYALDEELTVGSGRVSNARGLSSATRDEHPNTPTIHVERESVDALPKPRFSLAAAANAKKKRAAPESSVATRAAVRVHLDDDDVDGRGDENDDDRRAASGARARNLRRRKN